jgi:hypothetical protein
MKIIRQIIRGCGTLPHVGEHPGTDTLIVLLVLGMIGGSQKGGWIGGLVGLAGMAIIIGPVYLYGAYGRACLSDELSSEQGAQDEKV